jgi:hypothetical protein
MADTKFYAVGTGCYCIQIVSITRSKAEPHACIGYVSRIIIKECNNKCTCPSNCLNRVDQIGGK